MKMLSKQFTLSTFDDISVENIENIIRNSGYEPLRWAIVKKDLDILIIESVVIELIN